MANNARNPICVVRLNDAAALLGGGTLSGGNTNQLLTGVIEAEVVNTNYYSADTFRVKVALAGAPAWFDIDALSTQSFVPLEVTMGTSTTDQISLIKGLVDDVDYDPAENTVELRGRDYTRFFIDNVVLNSFYNQSLAAVVAALAEAYGLTLDTGDYDLPTTKVGSFSNGSASYAGDGRTQWDLLTSLAAQLLDDNNQSLVTFVQGDTLYFGPRPAIVNYTLNCARDRDTNLFRILPASNAAAGPAWGGFELQFSRNISVLRNVAVEFWADQDGKPPLSRRYPVDAPSAPYRFQARRNTASADLLTLARARQQDISRHELKLDFSLPGDSVLNQACLLQVSGVSSSLDQPYFVQSVTRHFSVDEGYVMSGSAQNRVLNDEEAA